MSRRVLATRLWRMAVLARASFHRCATGSPARWTSASTPSSPLASTRPLSTSQVMVSRGGKPRSPRYRDHVMSVRSSGSSATLLPRRPETPLIATFMNRSISRERARYRGLTFRAGVAPRNGSVAERFEVEPRGQKIVM